MHIGTVLLQPQRITRANVTDPSLNLVEDVLSLVMRVAVDKALGGHILETMGASFDATAAQMVKKVEANFDAAQQKLRGQLNALIEFLPGFVSPLAEVDDPAELLETVAELLTLFADSLKDLSVDDLRKPIKGVLDVFQKDLGINSAFIEGQVWGLIDDIIARLQKMPAEANQMLRVNRLGVISTLRRIKRHLKGKFAFPEISADDLAISLIAYLRRAGIDEVAAKVACVGKGAGEVGKAGAAITSLVPYTGFAENTLGAAESSSVIKEKYLWYASWLSHYDSEIYLDPEQEKIFKVDGELIDRRTDWKMLDPFVQHLDPHYTFNLISEDTMEMLAYVTAMFAEGADFIMNLTSIKRADEASPISNALLAFAYTVVKGAVAAPFSFLLLNHWGVATNNFWGKRLANIPVILATVLSSLQGLHTNAAGGKAFVFWIMQLLGDVKKAFTCDAIPEAARDAILSGLTLMNYKGEGSPPIVGEDLRPLNRNEVNGIVGPVTTVFNILLTKVVPREKYAFPFQGPGSHAAEMWVLYNLVAGTGFGLLGGFVGVLIAQIFSRSIDWGLMGKTMLTLTAKSLGFFWINLFSFKENDTDDGKYNPRGPAFAGYPSSKGSPYRLPWAGDSSYMCVQGNQGFWSHNNFGSTPQVYAFDFALDQGDEVLAARPGTVVDYFDWVPDDTNETTPASGPTPTAADPRPAGGLTIYPQTLSRNWNFILIRHDCDDNGVSRPPNDDYDLDEGSTAESKNVITTYGVYGHGRDGSVRKVFGDRSVAAQDIIGTKVKQGQVIMLAGSTGVSAHNHLHIHIVPGPASDVAPPIRLDADPNDNTIPAVIQRTIPFVFDDVDGPPLSLTYYTSKNSRVP